MPACSPVTFYTRHCALNDWVLCDSGLHWEGLAVKVPGDHVLVLQKLGRILGVVSGAEMENLEFCLRKVGDRHQRQIVSWSALVHCQLADRHAGNHRVEQRIPPSGWDLFREPS